MGDHRKYLPSKAVNVTKLTSALNITKDNTCPNCLQQTLTVKPLDHPCLACQFPCTFCHQNWDPVQMVARHKTEKDEQKAVEWMRDAGVLTSQRASGSDAIAAYRRYVASRKAFSELEERAVTVKPENCPSEAHDALGVRSDPYIANTLWTLTVGEIDDVIRGRSEPTRSLVPDLHARRDAIAVVLPSYDRLRELVGVWVSASTYANGTNRWAWRGAIDAEPGVWKLGSVDDHYPVSHVIGLGPDVIAPLAFAKRDNAANTVFSVAASPYVRHEALFPSDNRSTYVYIDLVRDLGKYALILASRINCRITSAILGISLGVEHADFGSCRWWSKWMAVEVGPGKSSGDVTSLVSAVKWNRSKEAAAVAHGHLTAEEAARITRAACRINVNVSEAVPVRRGLTVTVTASEWLWEEKGVSLLQARPVVTRVYRGDDRRVHHRGHVVYQGKMYPFDSPHFRKRAVDVIDACLLRHGVTPPAVHPMIAPHVGTVAIYLMGTK